MPILKIFRDIIDQVLLTSSALSLATSSSKQTPPSKFRPHRRRVSTIAWYNLTTFNHPGGPGALGLVKGWDTGAVRTTPLLYPVEGALANRGEV